jgi:hypothetical protein
MGQAERTSFSEEKEAKRLFTRCSSHGLVEARRKRTNVFWFFFSKKNNSFFPYRR